MNRKLLHCEAGALIGWRLHCQGFRGFNDCAAALRHCLAYQGQDELSTLYSFHLRTGLDRAAIETELASGAIYRTHLLRPTWHYVHQLDFPLLVALSGPRLQASLAATRRQLGWHDKNLERALGQLQTLLTAQPLSTRQLLPLLDLPGPNPGRALRHLLIYGRARGLLVEINGRNHWLDYTAPANFSPEEGTYRLVRAFLGSRGPSSLADLARWVNQPRRQLRAALQEFPQLRCGAGRCHYLPDTEGAADFSGLLPLFDEALLSHRDLPLPQAPDFPPQPGFVNGQGFILKHNRAVGLYRRPALQGRVRLEPHWAPGQADEGLTANFRIFYDI